MGLTNTQYDSIMRSYQLQQSKNMQELQERQEEISRELPEIDAIDAQIASQSIQCARARLSGAPDTLQSLKEQITQLSHKKATLLRSHGYPEDYLQLHYRCKDCQDTGYIDSKKCHCLRQAAIDLLYMQSNIREILKVENFDAFSLNYYSEDMIDPVTQMTARQTAQKAYYECVRFTESFDECFGNLFLYGDTGLGKTFLSHCVADALLKTGHSVLYFSAFQLFEECASYAFRKNTAEPDQQFHQQLVDCDLLIIDDLGTELVNSFVCSELFHIINDRILLQKSTIISTNLALPIFADTYSERIFSRITSNYTMLKMIGKDIRIQKKIGIKP